jgi:hypothetical protein
MKIILVLLALACSCTPKTKPDSQITYEYDKKTGELLVRVKLPEGMHAYAPGEPIGRPIELVIDPKNTWQLAAPPSLPVGDAKHLLNQAFEIKAKLKSGHGPISGVFKMQLCSDSSCERPQDYPFVVDQ